MTGNRATPPGSLFETVIHTEYPVDETLDRCVELVEWIEARGHDLYPRDEKLASNALTLAAHIRVLRDDLVLTQEATACEMGHTAVPSEWHDEGSSLLECSRCGRVDV